MLTPGDRDIDVVRETVDGLRVYFDRALSPLLLYRFERPQYGTILKVRCCCCLDLSGACAHCVRLFSAAVFLPAGPSECAHVGDLRRGASAAIVRCACVLRWRGVLRVGLTFLVRAAVKLPGLLSKTHMSEGAWCCATRASAGS